MKKGGYLSCYALICIVVCRCYAPDVVLAQTVSAPSPTTATSTTNATNTSNPIAQVVVQSVTGGSSSSLPATPMAPAMPSFAGGPCLGPSSVFSASLPGISFGRGNNVEDGSCQRRNWVQTLIGVGQHVSPQDRQFYNKLAFQVMREDPYLQGAFERLGIAPVRPSDRTQTLGEPVPVADTPQQGRTSPSKTCVVVLPVDAPDPIIALLAKRGCAAKPVVVGSHQ